MAARVPSRDSCNSEMGPENLVATAVESTGIRAGRPLLEAQVVDAADSLAYDTHDIDDALSVGLITPTDLHEVEFWQRAVERVRQRHGELAPEQFQPTVVRTLIDWQVEDLLHHTRQTLRQRRIASVENVRTSPDLLVGPSPEVRAWKTALEDFLRRRV